MIIALATIGIIAGIALLLGGGGEAFAGMMSDAPAEGEAVSNKGCIAAVVGLALLVGSILALVLLR